MTDKISIQDFAKVEIRVGKVVEAEGVEKSEKLIRLTVDFGDYERTIFTGVRSYGYMVEDFVGKQFLFVTNLEPKKIMEEESQGMILAVGEDRPIFIEVKDMPIGAKVR
ncbi:MAG: methionine--tRNA ligase subunit beta [Candidatus Beckwithbacteria bacterium]